MAAELKPCHSCGAKVELVTYGGRDYVIEHADLLDRKPCLFRATHGLKNRRLLIRLWNRRSDAR